MAIVSTGIGSGLNIESLVTQLMQAESTPLTLVQSKETSFKSKLSAFGTLKSAISSFQTAVKSVTGSALAALTAKSGDEDVLKVSTPSGGGATAGTYAIEVSKLATGDKLSSAGIDPAATFNPAGSSMTITVGSGKAVNIPLDDFSLSGLASAINGTDAGVTATVVNDGTKNHLVVTAKDTGAANTVKIAATGSVAQFDNTDPANTTMSWQQKAGDAEFTVDGMKVVKPSNTVTDAIKGVTLDLAETNVGDPVKVTITKDSDAIKKNVQGFIDAYNKIASTVNSLTSYNTSTKTGAVLNGDSSARNILTSIRSELGKAISDAGDLKNLSDIGIAFQRDGTLMLEKPEKLQKAIDGNFDNLSKLFSSTSGVGTRLTTLTTAMLGSKGVIQTRTDGINDTLKRLADQETSIQDRLTQTEARYRKQFNALDSAMANMKSTSNYLAQQLAALSSSY
jgi:flagellar hook-associated protein 2